MERQGRTYQTTHPWITFEANFRHASYRRWMMVGEAMSQCQHIAGAPLRPEVARDLYLVYLSKGVHATTAIEGNTLTEDQIRRQVEKNLTLPRSQEYLGIESQNIIDACDSIARELHQKSAARITPERIRQFNALVLQGLRTEDGVVPGQYRTYSVGGMGYRGAPSEDCPYLVERLCEWLNGPSFQAAEPELTFALTLFKSILAHLYIAWIHPFGDGNGRTARLLEFQILVQSGMVPYPAGHLLSNHYNKTRSAYYLELDRSSKTGGGTLAFIEYAVQGFVDGLQEQLDFIRDKQLRVTWENYVHEQFRDKNTPAGSRQKHLALDLPERVTPRKDLVHVSTRVASEYARKGDKALTRDLNALVHMGLITKRKGGYAPNRDLILAFLPPGIAKRQTHETDAAP